MEQYKHYCYKHGNEAIYGCPQDGKCGMWDDRNNSCDWTKYVTEDDEIKFNDNMRELNRKYPQQILFGMD